MSDTPDHVPGATGEQDNRRHQNPIAKAVSRITGSAKGDHTEPRRVRGWEQPLEEQQAPGDGEPSRSSEQP